MVSKAGTIIHNLVKSNTLIVLNIQMSVCVVTGAAHGEKHTAGVHLAGLAVGVNSKTQPSKTSICCVLVLVYAGFLCWNIEGQSRETVN